MEDIDFVANNKDQHSQPSTHRDELGQARAGINAATKIEGHVDS